MCVVSTNDNLLNFTIAEQWVAWDSTTNVGTEVGQIRPV